MTGKAKVNLNAWKYDKIKCPIPNENTKTSCYVG
jgi:hypothetical protein